MSGYLGVPDDADPTETGLRAYVDRIAAALGVGSESTSVEVADRASAYVALDDRLARYPTRDVALVWTDTQGWAVGGETHSGEDLLMLAWYGPELVPDPDDVVAFAKAVLAAENAGQPAPPADPPVGRVAAVRARLAAYQQPVRTDV